MSTMSKKKKASDDRMQEAWRIAVELHKLGIKPVSRDNWIVLKPAPPFDLLMQIIQLPEGLVESILPKVIADADYAAKKATRSAPSQPLPASGGDKEKT